MKSRVCVLLVLSGFSTAASGSGCGGSQAAQGRAWFGQTEFRRAAAGFAKAIAAEPECADAHFWLGQSFVRRYEMTNPLFAGKFIRKARLELERAVELEPRRTEYVVELASLYIDSPEYFRGALERAAGVLELLPPGGAAGDDLRHRLAIAWQEQRAPGRRLKRALVWLGAWAGYGMPWL